MLSDENVPNETDLKSFCVGGYKRFGFGTCKNSDFSGVSSANTKDELETGQVKCRLF